MKYWMVIHDLEAYEKQPGLIGKNVKYRGKIEKVSKGDRIIYYATGDSVIVGTFDVTSQGQIKKGSWNENEEYLCYSIKPKKLTPPPLYINIKKMLKCLPSPMSIFPDGVFKSIRLRGQTAVELTPEDFKMIEDYIREYQPEELNLFNGPPNEEDLGEPMDLEVLYYAPTSEQGVVVLFAHFMEKFPKHKFVKMEFIRQAFPDACVIEKVGKKHIRKYVEFEFNSKKFKEHVRKKKHAQTKCDYVICWEHDWATCPIEVIELKSVLKEIGVIKEQSANS